jgi:hypothetical protein
VKKEGAAGALFLKTKRENKYAVVQRAGGTLKHNESVDP